MKKLLIVLFGLAVSVANGQGVKLVTPENVKLEVSNFNTWLMCTLPDIWKAEDLSEFSETDDPDKRGQFSLYIQNWYSLMDRYYSDEDEYETLLTDVNSELQKKYDAIINSLTDEERKATLVKSCDEDWGEILRDKRKQLGLND